MSARIHVFCKKHSCYIVTHEGQLNIKHPFDLQDRRDMWCPYSTEKNMCANDPNDWRFIIT